MNILDFHKSEEPWFSYDTVQRVWGEDIEINVVFDNAEDVKRLNPEEISLRGVIRPLAEKLKFVEENREKIGKTVVESVEGVSEDDLKSLYLSWILFTMYVDTRECELYLYVDFDRDIIDDAEIAVTVHNDNTLTVEGLE